MNIFKMELYKLKRKKLIWAIFACCCIPIFYGVGIKNNFSAITISTEVGLLTCFDFLYTMWEFSLMIIFPIMLVIILACNTLSSEIENGQIRSIVVRVCDRKKIIFSKMASIFSVLLAFFVVYNLISIVAYYIFMVRTPYATATFLSSTFLSDLISIIISLLEIMILVCIALLLGVKAKIFPTVLATLGIYILSQYLKFIPIVKYIIPSYVRSSELFTSGSTLIIMGKAIIFIGLFSLFIYGLYKLVCNRFKSLEVI